MICKMLFCHQNNGVFTLELLVRTKCFIEVNSWERCPRNYESGSAKPSVKTATKSCLSLQNAFVGLTSRCVNPIKTWG